MATVKTLASDVQKLKVRINNEGLVPNYFGLADDNNRKQQTMKVILNQPKVNTPFRGNIWPMSALETVT